MTLRLIVVLLAFEVILGGNRPGLLAKPKRTTVLRWRAVANAVSPAPLVLPAVAALLLYLVALAVGMQSHSYDIWGAVLIAPLLVLLTVPLLKRTARAEEGATFRLLLVALLTKMAFTVLRYVVVFGVYAGSADASVYSRYGSLLAPGFRNFDFRTQGQGMIGTGFVRVLTGLLYAGIGPTKLGGFLVFSWMGFWGLYLFHRAFRIAVPGGDTRRYDLLLFFLPSMLFWPSSIGKEAWVTFTIGLAAYGAARVLGDRRRGLLLLGVGMLGTFMARPHVALILFIALTIAYVVRRTPTRAWLGPMAKILAIPVIVVIGVVMLNQVQSFLDVDQFGNGGVDQALQKASEGGIEGTSSYRAVKVKSPTTFGLAVVTVLFRPLPTEARNVQALIASMEGLLLAVLGFLAVPRIVGAMRGLRSRPFIALVISYTLLFCFAFSSVGNFGILTRQRVQVLPFLLVLFCLPKPTTVRSVDVQRR